MVDCRRILKWTYAYGYYRFAESAQAQTSAHSSTAADALRQQQEFFEFNQVSLGLMMTPWLTSID